MKKLMISALLLPFSVLPQADHPSSTTLAEVRTGQWPISLEMDTDHRGTVYSLLFRDQQVMREEVMDTLEFGNLEQLRYFDQGLSALKTGHNGDIARFKNYSLQRTDKKFEGTFYILRDKYGLTQFRQPEADILSKTIRGL